MTTPKHRHDNDAHVLAGRLNTGWMLIDREPDPARRRRLEDHWLQLLRDYERAFDAERPAPTVPTATPQRLEATG